MKLYQQMTLIRTLETELQRLCDTGELTADLHMSKGEEAIAVGVCAALQPQDLLVVHHRMIGWALSKGMPLDLLVAELLGKSSGVCGGRAGEMHMVALKYGLAHSFQLVGTAISVAAGVGWALKNYKKSDGIVVAVCGDAATANGQFHEGLNIAAVNKVPMLLVVENNGLAGNVRPEYYQPVPHVEDRASAYGVRHSRVDGNDVQWVFNAVQEASDYVRLESRPYLLECICTRLSRHKQGQGDIRTKEEIAELAKRDPLLYEESRLAIGPELKAQLLAAAQRDVRLAIDAASLAPLPAFGGPQ
mgnify:CR=1 FL=1